MRRRAYLATAAIAVFAIGTIPVVRFTPRLVWNASASVPIGLYSVRPVDGLEVADLVAVQPPDRVAGFLDARGYLPLGVPLMKRVAALPGQSVCRTADIVAVDGIAMATARQLDRLGRPLPAWQGCHRIADGEVFLMNWQHPGSLDGRYFGPLPSNSIIGRAVPLLTDEEGTGRYEWRAPTR